MQLHKGLPGLRVVGYLHRPRPQACARTLDHYGFAPAQGPKALACPVALFFPTSGLGVHRLTAGSAGHL